MRKNRQLLNITLLCTDRGVDYRENGDWTNICCPHCGDTKYHLGYNFKEGFWSCFKCGSHRDYETIAALLDIPIHEAAKTCKRYEVRTMTRPGPDDVVQANVARATAVKMPYGTGPMTDKHRQYLKSRNFDPERLEAEWGLLGTGPLGPFSHRIIIPIEQNGKVVCFQGRDITGKSPTRYKSCPDEIATISIKNCIYGLDKVQGDTIVIVEGAFKVMRLGSPAVGTFGAVVTDTQLLLLKPFHRRVIMFDNDKTGKEKSHDLAGRLSIFPNVVEIYELPDVTGPDGLSDEDAKAAMREFSK